MRLAALPGHEAEAQAVKDRMPCIVPAGVCSGGHAVKNLVRHSGLLQIDMDHTGARTAEVCGLLRQLPYVVVAHMSFSHNGVRAFALVAAGDVERNYERLYAAVGEAVSRHAGHDYDSKCKILTQPSFYSWDADAYYNPGAETFRMQWGEEMTGPEGGVAEREIAGNGNAGNRSSGTGTRTSETKTGATAGTDIAGTDTTGVANTGTGTNADTTDAGTAAASASVSASAPNAVSNTASNTTSNSATPSTPDAAPGFLAQFLNDFEHRNPFRRGERNDLALKLGRVARSKGFSKEELEEITRIFTRRYSAADFTAEDIRQRINAGYQFFESLPKKTEEYKRGQSEAHSLYDPAEPPDEEPDEEDLLEKNNELRAQSPYIPESVYEMLPQLLQDCVRYSADPRERDIVLLSCLNCCSAVFRMSASSIRTPSMRRTSTMPS